jgi:hypothetical protein
MVSAWEIIEMKTTFLLVAATASLFAGSVASAAVVDDFNRPDAPTLGANWTLQAGSATISGNAATAGVAAESLATLNGVSSNTVSFDVVNNGTALQYVAGAIGFGNGDSIFVKVQNNGIGNGASTGAGFDRFGFYINNDDNAIGSFGFLSGVFDSGNVSISLLGSIATLTITPTIGAIQTYTYDYGFTPLGTGVGLGLYGNATADNFAVVPQAVPEPATWAMMIAGFGLAGGALRRRKAALVLA